MIKERGSASHGDTDIRVVQRMYLENTDESKGHYKFYQVDFCYDKNSDEYVVCATWGRIGNESGFQYKARGKKIDEVLEPMEKVMVQKLFSRGYNMKDVQRWAHEARPGEQSCFEEEDWD